MVAKAPAAMEVLPNHHCPLCGKPNACAAAKSGRHDIDCWCVRATINPTTLALVPEHLKNKACLCQACAETPSQPQT
ncbi:MAG: cysteine-rich CWC family protein [Betaproteobacteria bacterium]